MKQWFVVYTQPSKETIAQQHLSEQGFEVYLPKYRKIRRHARKVEEILSPLFPRYLFIGLDLKVDQWRSVQGTRGVSYLLINDHFPAVVPQEIILHLKSLENSQGVVSIDTVVPFSKGDSIRVLDGAFKDYVGVFKNMDDRQRVQLLLSCLGREVNIVISANMVEAA